ncbi:MAG: DUF190 domain-containing protein [Nitrospirales bacterium]
MEPAGHPARGILESPVTEIQGQAKLLRIVLGEADKVRHIPLYEVIVQDTGLVGAIVWRGILAFGRTSRIHTTKLWICRPTSRSSSRLWTRRPRSRSSSGKSINSSKRRSAGVDYEGKSGDHPIHSQDRDRKRVRSAS